jgi:phosphoenolpyruvate phosphomutase
MADKPALQIMAAHSPLSAVLAEEAGFDGLWASGFELSALLGLPDVSMVSMTEHLDMTRRMVAASTLPVIADIDTGFGNALNVIYAVAEYERAGAAAVVIEDKTFPKVTSLVEGGRQELLRAEEFQGKVEAATRARSSADFVIVARTEALIAGRGEAEALRRAHGYVEAGADMILVHSKQTTSQEIKSFVANWSSDAPLAVVPTSYPSFTPADVRACGNIALYIYGNHAIRASVGAMQQTFAEIISDDSMVGANENIVSVQEIFRLQGMDQVRADEAAFLR